MPARAPTPRVARDDAPTGLLPDIVLVTISRPGPLFVRLRPDPRGLVILNNFDLVEDDPLTGCPRLGPIESVGTVSPGDAVVSPRGTGWERWRDRIPCRC